MYLWPIKFFFYLLWLPERTSTRDLEECVIISSVNNPPRLSSITSIWQWGYCHIVCISISLFAYVLYADNPCVYLIHKLVTSTLYLLHMLSLQSVFLSVLITCSGPTNHLFIQECGQYWDMSRFSIGFGLCLCSFLFASYRLQVKTTSLPEGFQKRKVLVAWIIVVTTMSSNEQLY